MNGRTKWQFHFFSCSLQLKIMTSIKTANKYHSDGKVIISSPLIGFSLFSSSTLSITWLEVLGRSSSSFTISVDWTHNDEFTRFIIFSFSFTTSQLCHLLFYLGLFVLFLVNNFGFAYYYLCTRFPIMIINKEHELIVWVRKLQQV